MRVKNRIRPDTTPGKKYPNGISSTVLSLYQFWLSAVRGGAPRRMTRPVFMAKSNFMEVYRRVITKYPGGKQKKPSTQATVAAMLNDLSFGRHELDYYKLRSLAEFVNLPSGVFLLFTHCASLERQTVTGSQRDEALLSVLNGLERIVELSKERLAKDGDIFMRSYADGDADSYLPNMAMLKAWRDAYNSEGQTKALG